MTAENTVTRPIKKIAIVAGEDSGDILGAGLIQALKARYPDCIFEGVGGERMQAEGFHSLFPMERLSVMGWVEPLKRLPELLGILRKLRKRFIKNPPDIFIGIDSPDFCLRIEKKLKNAGIPTVHYVSPSVWAWRQGRIKTIKLSVDLMLTLFPFEAGFYRQHDVDVEFVGHPLADDIPISPKRGDVVDALGLSHKEHYIALLPGSRKFEVENVLPVFLKAAEKITHWQKRYRFLIPASNSSRYRQIEALLQNCNLPIQLFQGRSREVMAAADAVVMASGTTTLEAMLLKKPMVVCYRVAKLSYFIYSKLVKVAHIALPNLLAEKRLVPELIQDDLSAEALSMHLEDLLQDPTRTQSLVNDFTRIHMSLKRNASEGAAQAIEQRWQQNWSLK
jgi:lipid-A-disaccharide synthase